MKPKSIVSALLLLFVCVSILYLVLEDRREKVETAVKNEEMALDPLKQGDMGEPGSSAEQQKLEESFVVYYFHRDVRCQTCTKLEALCQEAVKSGFSEELDDGLIWWRVLNVDEPVNEHFIDRFQLHSQSLVVERYRHGKRENWKNLEKIWDLLDEKEDFMTYVQSEIRVFLEES
jgi:hypothetical protein